MTRLLLAALLPLMLVGCSSTPFGRQLGGSFDAPASPPARESPKPESQPQPPKSETVAVPAPEQKQPELAEPSQPAPIPEEQPKVEAPAQTPPASEPRDPRPYRVILRLPSADPSAPAEAVTEALRSAGLPFEVETIERLQPAKKP